MRRQNNSLTEKYTIEMAEPPNTPTIQKILQLSCHM
jgi:cell division protein FtsX